MGFHLCCVVARVEGDVADRILAVASTVRFVRARRITEPFAGIVAAYDEEVAQETIYDEAIAAGATEDDASEAGAQARWDTLEPLAAAFPDVRFAQIHADCFGGTCMYHGHTSGPGDPVRADGHDAHQRLLAALGAIDPPWFFAPFTRGFFDTGEPPAGPQRREVRCSVAGTLRDVALVAIALLRPPWRVTIATERDAIIMYGDDDLWLSLNAAGELRASSHLEPEPTAAAIAELVDALAATGELVLRDAAGTVLRTIVH